MTNVRSISDCYLYGICDLGYVEKGDLLRVAESMIQGGVDLIQLRAKQATLDDLTQLAARLHKLTAAASIPLIINDHAEIASRVPVEGVHVGQDDLAIASVRQRVGRPIWLGKSTHSLDQAVAAEGENADYIGFGPIFATPTKPDYVPVGLGHIAAVHRRVRLPMFCIGGIKLENLDRVIEAGGQRVVIVSGLLQATDITAYARACKDRLASLAATAAEGSRF
jgi:thiamine-phosphate pyrophosphorylase